MVLLYVWYGWLGQALLLRCTAMFYNVVYEIAWVTIYGHKVSSTFIHNHMCHNQHLEISVSMYWTKSFSFSNEIVTGLKSRHPWLYILTNWAESAKLGIKVELVSVTKANVSIKVGKIFWN